jgi:hypothetical protein
MNIMIGASVVAAASVTPADATAPCDPIFAAIEAHKQAHNTCMAAIRAFSAIERRQFDGEEVDDEESDLAAIALHDATDHEYRALDEVLETEPRTLPGAAALASYVAGFKDIAGSSEHLLKALQTLASALTRITTVTPMMANTVALSDLTDKKAGRRRVARSGGTARSLRR